MLLNPSTKKMLMFAGAALLASITALAQMQQQQPQQPGAGGPPGAPANPGMEQPGMPSATTNPNSNQAMEDKAFVEQALQGGMAEVQLGQMAAQKGSGDDVKQFGQKMVDDHTQLNNTMLQVAKQVGVKPPAKLSKKDNGLKTKLEGLSGTQFDDAYIEAMVKDHKKDESSFKFEAQQAQIPAVKQAAGQGAQVIAGHLQMVEQIAQTHNLGNGKSKSGGI